ncbi:hypothetical protein COW95_00710 [Candidatus Peregrinibacteria bacterium CG22_combo_CG10-13_8_21_14_all_49_11]|nr:MAG: hypothetical protein COW95_00710 [Candidatus Peregrinibacteria bacterium CG22_combo_CG10-13_8_21_14_all_49_11]
MLKSLWRHLQRHDAWCVGGFFMMLLFVGYAIHDNYGISWDEKTQYVIGFEAYEAVFKGEEWSTDPGRRYHGPVFELFLYGLEQVLPLENAQEVFFMRHFVSFLVFVLGVFFLYLLAAKYFRSRLWGLLTALMLVLSPRIFGHAFFNSRDVPTLALFTVSMYTLVCVLERRRWWMLLLHAASCALLVSVRMTGVLLPVLTVFFFLVAAWGIKKGGRRIRLYSALRSSVAFLVLWVLFTMAFWPLLWTHPVQHFLEAFRYMSTKAPGGFYMGEKLSHNPWHWIPVWMFISTPLLYTVCFLLGCTALGCQYLGSFRTFLWEKRTEALVLIWFFVPILAVIILRAGIFDTWRHLFFIYPAFLLIGTIGVRWLVRQLKTIPRLQKLLNALVVGLCILSFFSTGLFMVRNHPLEYIYFSIPNRFVDGYFELDYWGLSYTEGLRFILENDQQDLIPYYPISSPGYSAFHALTPEERSRLFLILWENFQPKYILDSYRETDYRRTLPEEGKVHTVRVGGIDVLGIYRVTNWQPQVIEQKDRMPGHILYFLFPQENFVRDIQQDTHMFITK